MTTLPDWVDSLLQKPDLTVEHLQKPAVNVCYLGVLVTKSRLQIQTFVQSLWA